MLSPYVCTQIGYTPTTMPLSRDGFAKRALLEPLNRYRPHLGTNAADAAPSIRLRATAKWRPDAAGGGDVAAMTVRVVSQAVETRACAHTSVQHDQLLPQRGQSSRRHR